MARKKKTHSTSPSERELDVLKVLWELQEAKVRDIHATLCPHNECAFTTVQTLLRIMCDKGLVEKRSENRTDFYRPVYTIEHATRRFVDKLFDGARDKLVLSMLTSPDVSTDELRTLEKMISNARKNKEKSKGE